MSDGDPAKNLDIPILTLRAVFFASAVGLALYLTQEVGKGES